MSTTTALPTESLTGTWVIDASHSEAGFTTRHAGIAKVRGSVAITEGTIVIGEDLTSSSGTAVLDPATIDTRDRKSTRLNSSQANISYAAFFFKKKNYVIN